MLKIFYTSDIHGSEACFRKFLDAGPDYGVDALIFGGDITGKLLVPIRERAGQFEASYQGKQHHFDSLSAAEDFERTLQDSGHYPVRLECGADDQLATDVPEFSSLFLQAMKERINRWLELADSRLRGTGIECYVMLGNDDPAELAELIGQSDIVVNPDEQKVLIHDDVEMVCLGHSNLTPFNSHREMPEERIESILNKLANQLTDVRAAIFNVHVPPYDSTLDDAPELDENLKAKSYDGQPRFIPVGSTAVRDIILQRQPLLGLHGHVHESGGTTSLGRTLCINPGSSFTTGVLHGVVVTIDRGRVCSFQLVTS
ncbi:MAG: metallophosphoesterase [Planctomycetes bacterium]|nr:metallophosphoesterase [Planctomycetota bacterium]MBL7044215.1 metallophosphoesterase [Pirellulaceae bacterium]